MEGGNAIEMREEYERRMQKGDKRSDLKRDGRGVGKEGAEERWKRGRKGASRREMEEEQERREQKRGRGVGKEGAEDRKRSRKGGGRR